MYHGREDLVKLPPVGVWVLLGKPRVGDDDKGWEAHGVAQEGLVGVGRQHRVPRAHLLRETPKGAGIDRRAFGQVLAAQKATARASELEQP